MFQSSPSMSVDLTKKLSPPSKPTRRSSGDSILLSPSCRQGEKEKIATIRHGVSHGKFMKAVPPTPFSSLEQSNSNPSWNAYFSYSSPALRFDQDCKVPTRSRSIVSESSVDSPSLPKKKVKPPGTMAKDSQTSIPRRISSSTASKVKNSKSPPPSSMADPKINLKAPPPYSLEREQGTRNLSLEDYRPSKSPPPSKDRASNSSNRFMLVSPPDTTKLSISKLLQESKSSYSRFPDHRRPLKKRLFNINKNDEDLNGDNENGGGDDQKVPPIAAAVASLKQPANNDKKPQPEYKLEFEAEELLKECDQKEYELFFDEGCDNRGHSKDDIIVIPDKQPRWPEEVGSHETKVNDENQKPTALPLTSLKRQCAAIYPNSDAHTNHLLLHQERVRNRRKE